MTVTIDQVRHYLDTNTSGDPANILNGVRAMFREPEKQEKASERVVHRTSTKVTLKKGSKSD